MVQDERVKRAGRMAALNDWAVISNVNKPFSLILFIEWSLDSYLENKSYTQLAHSVNNL